MVRREPSALPHLCLMGKSLRIYRNSVKPGNQKYFAGSVGQIPAFPAPFFRKGREVHANLGRSAPRECGRIFIWTPSLRGAKRRGNPFFLHVARWIASLALAMT